MNCRPPSASVAMRTTIRILPIFICLSLYAGNATWSQNPTSGDWNTASNWTPGGPPNGPADTATFQSSAISNLSLSANTQLSGVTFGPGGGLVYTIAASPGFTLTVSGFGITNNSARTQNFVAPADNGGIRLKMPPALTPRSLLRSWVLPIPMPRVVSSSSPIARARVMASSPTRAAQDRMQKAASRSFWTVQMRARQHLPSIAVRLPVPTADLCSFSITPQPAVGPSPPKESDQRRRRRHRRVPRQFERRRRQLHHQRGLREQCTSWLSALLRHGDCGQWHFHH